MPSAASRDTNVPAEEVMKLLIMQFSNICRFFLCLRSKQQNININDWIDYLSEMLENHEFLCIIIQGGSWFPEADVV
jgi:hypothetical protein